jgi:hypothetical protein
MLTNILLNKINYRISYLKIKPDVLDFETLEVMVIAFFVLSKGYVEKT